MLKRKPQQSSQRIPLVRVFRDDLERFHAEIAAVSPGHIDIEADEFKLESIADIADLPDRVKTFQILALDPSVVLSFGRHGASVFRPGDDVQSIGLAESLRQGVRATQRRYAWIYSWWVVAALTLVNLLVTLASATDRANHTLSLVISLAMASSTTAVVHTKVARSSLIYTSTRGESLPFLRRNADALVVGTMIALIGAAAGSVITWLLTR